MCSWIDILEWKKLKNVRVISHIETWLWQAYFESQTLALFDTSPLTHFSKFYNFLWVCWFLGKNISNFLPLSWKLHNSYCHNQKLIELPTFRQHTLKVRHPKFTIGKLKKLIEILYILFFMQTSYKCLVILFLLSKIWCHSR